MHKCLKSVLSAFTLEVEVQRMSPPKEPRRQHFLGSDGAKSLASQAKFGSSKMLDPNFRREAKKNFHSNIQNLTKYGLLDGKGIFHISNFKFLQWYGV